MHEVGGGDVAVEALGVLHLVDGELDHPHLEGIVRGDPFGIFEHLRLQVGRWSNAVHQAKFQRLRGVHETAFEQELLRLARMDVPRHGEILEVGAEEHGAVGGVDDVHGAGDDPAAEDAVALHPGDGGLRHVAPAHRHFHEQLAGAVEATPHAALVWAAFLVGPLLRRAKVVPAGEMLAGAEECNDMHVDIFRGDAKGVVELL